MTEAEFPEVDVTDLDPQDPRPRPMVAILDARPEHLDEFRTRVIELVRDVRRESGCVAFIPYEARDVPRRFYLYEVYANTAAFLRHLETEHVKRFVAGIPTLSTSSPADLHQLDEIAVP